jgi:hypothetical protein
MTWRVICAWPDRWRQYQLRRRLLRGERGGGGGRGDVGSVLHSLRGGGGGGDLLGDGGGLRGGGGGCSFLRGLYAEAYARSRESST